MNERLMASENEFNKAYSNFELFHEMLKKAQGRAAEETALRHLKCNTTLY
ncbi:hypothetical protein [Piscirickettsia salmonis]|nr:hypothetical protein [Piscirickettsia salmonis]QGN79246.1 hypothetical protein Psal001_03511 [Piscirickettsia salmonis]QGN82837.1 hypothetical protein Psal002_03537 [Piscirickettsia salmonis]QGN86349.1 hypothetical protein Psal003_03458 [Piscirickettsia salmonis]QGN89853.1 hypothetical protein Psal004_03448 [Piscirickettsia salmonis]QGO11231.1 hypothetical protein Psal010a_03468 [Piscirickettsia salmonis]